MVKFILSREMTPFYDRSQYRQDDSLTKPSGERGVGLLGRLKKLCTVYVAKKPKMLGTPERI
jgi:hypothetical protein